MQATDRLFSVSEVLRILNTPRHKLVYLFESRKLKSEDFLTLDNGHRIFRQCDLERIKKALWEVGAK